MRIYTECGGEGETAGVRKVHGGQRRFNYTRPAPRGSSVLIESMFPEMELIFGHLFDRKLESYAPPCS